VPEILRLFERIVEERGDASALVARDATLSFAELRAQAKRLATELRAAGVREGDVVALDLGRSSQHVVGMLGAWYAGAAFLPIDPAAPPARVEAMLLESSARALLRPASHGASIRPVANGRPPPGRDGLAYVIYTSGSTGRAKGVRVGHRGLCPVLLAQIAAFGLVPGKRSLLTLSTAFDASISDIGTALLSGATLVIADEPLGPATLLERMRADAITHADLPPSLLPVVDPSGAPACLEAVIIGGEVCPPHAVRSWARRVRVINVYGPTEATICTSLCECDARGWVRPLVGDPLPHVEYALDEGELLISGPALALGYVDRPDLEAKRFVDRDGTRWYRTGDLVRRHDDGALEFVGRIDRQLKLRGLLVCPEEIELQLRASPEVADAVVEACEDDGRGMLSARVVPKPGATVTARTLRERLETRLPGWMIPHVVLVPAIARGVCGKVERARSDTPAPVAADRRAGLVARAFEEALRAGPVGEHDDFLDLGGDSLAALEVAALAQLSGIAIEAETVVLARTPAAIAHARPVEPWTVEHLEQLAEQRATEVADAPRHAAHGDDWLVTGANGFLGARLVPELLARTTTRIHCVVRGASDSEARARLGEIARNPRVCVHAGDVSAPRLGLRESTWVELTRSVAHVVHAAAALSLSLPFGALEATNVRGALEVARFVRAGGRKTLHHVSSLAVLASTDLPVERLDERTELPPGTRVIGAYAQTKWLSEALLRRTVPDLRIVRPGLLTADSTTGVGSRTCPLASFLRAVAGLGCLPVARDDELRVDVTPVDRAAVAIAAAVTSPACPAVLHVASERGVSVADLTRALRRHVAVERVSRDEFLQRARRGLGRDVAIALIASSFRLLGTDAQRAADLFLHTGRLFPCGPLEELLGGGADWVDEGLLGRYADRACVGREAAARENVAAT
jgi:amino acid adenylation domain-containing protein/thioester reductase-like protein